MHSLRIIALFALYIILPLGGNCGIEAIGDRREGGHRGGLLSAQEWIPINREARPYTRWWWLGSAVDSVGLDYNLREFARVGIGGVEITPIYGVQGNEKNDIDFLSVRSGEIQIDNGKKGKKEKGKEKLFPIPDPLVISGITYSFFNCFSNSTSISDNVGFSSKSSTTKALASLTALICSSLGFQVHLSLRDLSQLNSGSTFTFG